MATLGRNALDDKSLFTRQGWSGPVTLHASLIVEQDLTVLGTETFIGDQQIDGNLIFQGANRRIIPGATSLSFRNAADTFANLTLLDAGTVQVNRGSLQVLTVGQGIAVKRGTNAKGGTFTANGATPVVVANTSVTTESVIRYSLKTVGGTPTAVFTSNLTPGASFEITAAVGNTSVYNYEIVELIP